jgi:urease accessory protein
MRRGPRQQGTGITIIIMTAIRMTIETGAGEGADLTDISARDLARIMIWLSPVFPVGAFSYSHAIEQAVHREAIADAESLIAWVQDLCRKGSLWNDCVLCAAAWRAGADPEALQDVADLAEAMAGSHERHMETMLQGEAFLAAIGAWPDEGANQDDRPASILAYPVAVGFSARRRGMALRITIIGFLQAYVANLVQVAMRLVPLGQTDGMRALAALESSVIAVASRAAEATIDDLGGCTLHSEIFAMNHETLSTRLFRT